MLHRAICWLSHCTFVQEIADSFSLVPHGLHVHLLWRHIAYVVEVTSLPQCDALGRESYVLIAQLRILFLDILAIFETACCFLLC